jgi:hypothetical protein
MTWSRAMARAMAATVGGWRWQAIALAAFLVRGGLLALLPALVILPTPGGLALVILDPSITGAGFGSPGPALVGLLAFLALAIGLLVAGTGLVGAWLDRALVAGVASDPRLAPVGWGIDVPLWRGLAVRLIAHVPTVAVVGAAAAILAGATYAELLSPSGPGPLIVRVILRAPLAVGAMVLAWLVGEAWGGVAARRLGLDASILGALGSGIRDLARPSGLATLAVTTLAVGAALVVAALVAGGAFDGLWPLVVGDADPGRTAAALVTFVAAWTLGLWLLAVAVAWRSAAWTAEVLRRG